MISDHLFYISIGIVITICFYVLCKAIFKIYLRLKNFLKEFKRVKSNKNFREIKL
jgi:hypothetical protein